MVKLPAPLTDVHQLQQHGEFQPLVKQQAPLTDVHQLQKPSNAKTGQQVRQPRIAACSSRPGRYRCCKWLDNVQTSKKCFFTSEVLYLPTEHTSEHTVRCI